jgi:hypothetical protein
MAAAGAPIGRRPRRQARDNAAEVLMGAAIAFDDDALERGAINSWQESPNHGNWCKVVRHLRHGLSCQRSPATLEEATVLSVKVNRTARSIDGDDDTAVLLFVPRNEARSTRLKERVSTFLCSIAFLLSTGLGNATDIDANLFRCIKDDAGASILRGQLARKSRRDPGSRQFDDRGRVSTGISASIDSGRGNGQARQGLQR